MAISPDVLTIDGDQECERIAGILRSQMRRLNRRGLVIAVSGGIDSSVVAGLCAGALGPQRCYALLLPECDSSQQTLELSRSVVECFEIPYGVEDITPMLEGVRCYQRRDEAIRRVVPEFGPGWRSKIVLPSVGDKGTYNLFSVVVQSPEGTTIKRRLPLDEYLQIVAATNFKQRTRKMLEYYHADRLNYAVAGTSNRLEYDQGFFVKNGDGAADVKPIAHLYKTQVYMLAQSLGVPEAVRRRPPTTDTYSLQQGQDEFYFSLPYREMDLCLYAKNNGISARDLAPVIGLSREQVDRVFADIEHKRRTTWALHCPPLLVDHVAEIEGSAAALGA